MKIDQNAVRAVQIRGLYSQSITSVLANVVSGGLLCFILRTAVDSVRLGIWMSVVVVVQIARIAILTVFRRTRREDDNLRFWGYLFTGVVFLSGATWGSVGIFFLPELPDFYHPIIALWMVGVSAGGIIAYAGYAPSALSAFVPINLPILLRLLVSPDLVHTTVAVSMGAYSVFILAAWRGIHRMLRQAIELNFEKKKEIEERTRAEAALVAANQKLEKAASEIKTLRGILPICAQCKKIRDDKGYWSRIETYIKAHSAAEFTHSICPECAETLYPNMKLSKE